MPGERELVEFFLRKFKARNRLPVPLGDDVSAWSLGGNRLAVLKVDMLTAGTDVLPGMSIRQAGWKAMVMAVSDLAAKGVKPLAALIGLGIPKEMVEKAGELAEGLKAAAEAYRVKIVGGDTNEAEELVLAVSLFGTCRKNEIVLRSGAKPGDLLAVTGNFGLTGAAFKILLEGYRAPEPLKKKILRSAYWPRARLSLGLKLGRLGATASIDSSDGLAWSLHELSKASKVGFELHRIPLAREAEEFARLHGLNPSGLALYGGEEYELVATFNPKTFMKAGKTLRGRFKIIGVATEKREIVYFGGKKEEKRVKALGWEHFRD